MWRIAFNYFRVGMGVVGGVAALCSMSGVLGRTNVGLTGLFVTVLNVTCLVLVFTVNGLRRTAASFMVRDTLMLLNFITETLRGMCPLHRCR